jgi:hypothetical protein
VMTEDGRDRFRCFTRIAAARRARPRQSLRERFLRPSRPDLGASLADYPGLPETAVELIMKTIGGDGRRDPLRRRYLDHTPTCVQPVDPVAEPARRGLINLADEVLATTNQAVAAAAQLDPSDVTQSTRSSREAHIGRSATSRQITHPHDPAPRGPRR